MSIKIYNPATNEWEQVASTVATGIKVIDVENRFTNDNVNDCLLETAADLDKLAGDVKYIYEHGTLGGGGGGGSSVPVLTLTGPSTREVKSDELVDILYNFTSPNPGDGVASILVDAAITSTPIKQGPNKQTVGPFAKGAHTVSIQVKDAQHILSAPIQVTIISGSLQLSTTFTGAQDYTLADDISIPYTIDTLNKTDPVYVDYTIDKAKFSVPAQVGANTLVIGKLQHMGPTYVTMTARNTNFVSNTLNFALVAADSENLFLIPVNYPDYAAPDNTVTTLTFGANLVIQYRVSLKGQTTFNSWYYVDDVLTLTLPGGSVLGVNSWPVGIVGSGTLTEGQHKFKIITATTDIIDPSKPDPAHPGHMDSIEFHFSITQTDYVPYPHATRNLIAQYDAVGKVNTSVNRDIWEDTSGNHVPCTLHNFNFTTNGWNNNALDVNGLAYAEIGLAPFLNGIKNGLTFEILFTTQCVGDVNAKVVYCRDPATHDPLVIPKGFDIDISRANFTGEAAVTSQIEENAWIKVSFVVNRGDPAPGTTNTQLVYVNGILSGCDFLLPNNPNVSNYTDNFAHPGHVYIGCGLDSSGQTANNSVSSIKSIRIYDRALSDLEIVTNYIADITDREEQLAHRRLNAMNDQGLFNPDDTSLMPLPSMRIVCDIAGMNEDSERPCQLLDYVDPNDATKNFRAEDQEAFIAWQGTSSRTYPVKNWTLRLVKGGSPFLFKPKDNWLSDLRWTLKANYMDSSNANNIGLQKFIYDYMRTNTPLYPPETMNPATRANVDGFPMCLYMAPPGGTFEFMGIYTWNIDRYAYQNYGFVTYQQTPYKETRSTDIFSYEILGNTASGAGAFILPKHANEPGAAAENWTKVQTEFRCRYIYNMDAATTTLGDGTTVLAGGPVGTHAELMKLVQWTNDCTDAEFTQDVETHWSLAHLVDYYLIAYINGMVDNLGKNMVLTTYGYNSLTQTYIFYPSFYDCDSTLGLDNSGNVRFADASLDPADYPPTFNTADSNLWTKLVRCFGPGAKDDRLTRRYQQMRGPRTSGTGTPWFSPDTAVGYVAGDVIDTVGENFYNMDARAKYLDQGDRSWFHACNGSRETFTNRWFMERFGYMDSVYGWDNDWKIVIRSNVTGDIYLDLRTYSAEMVRISFEDGGTPKTLLVKKDTPTRFFYTLVNATNNNIEINGARLLMYVDGIERLKADNVNIAQAPKLVELNVSGSPYIQTLELGSNSYLQTLLCNDCPKLGGAGATIKTLNVSLCNNLRELDLSNTHIVNVNFPPAGGVLQSFDGSNSDLTSFTLKGQDYLESVLLGGCASLTDLAIDKCGGLEELLMDNTFLGTVSVTNCASLRTINVGHTRNLHRFDISGCPNLRNLYMAGVVNPALTEINLSQQPVLESFDMSASNYVQFVALPSFPYNHFNQRLDVANLVAILPTKNVNLPSLVVRLSDIADPIPANNYTAAVVTDTNSPNYGYVTITLIASPSVPPTQSLIYVSYSNNCCITTFTCYQSSITSVKFGFTAQYPTRSTDGLYVLDLSGLPLTSVNFSGCANLNEVRNINYVGAGTAVYNNATYGVFSNCSNIQTISGTMVLRDNCNATFLECRKLKLDGLSLDLTNATLAFGIFQNCLALTAANAFYALQAMGSKVTTLGRVLIGCTGITGNFFQNFPTMFNKCTGNTSLSESFNGCTGITGSVPATLFSYMPNLNNIDYCFYNCTSLSGAVPAGLLDSNTKVITANWTFRNTKIASFPATLLNKLTELNNVNGMFMGCTSLTLTSVDPNLFVNNAKLIDASNFFNGCTNVQGSVPPGLFNNIPMTNNTNQLTKISYFFANTKMSGAIPTGFLDNSLNLQEIEGLFYGCTLLTGAIPPNLLLNNTKLTRVGAMFFNCTGLTGSIPPTILRGKPNLSATNQMFMLCSSIDSDIPDDFLLDAGPKLTDISEMFSGMTKLHGTIQVRDSYWRATEIFKLAPIAFLNAESPDLTHLVVKLNAQSPPLIQDLDYRVQNNGNVTTITMIRLTPTSLLAHLPHKLAMGTDPGDATKQIATLDGTGVDQSTLVVRDSLGATVYQLNSDYTLSTGGGNIVITRVPTGAIPSGTSTLSVEYDRTVTVDYVAVLDTYNIDPSSVVVRPVIGSDLGDISAQNLIVDVTGLNNAATCVVEVSVSPSSPGGYTGVLTAQTTKDGVIWKDISNQSAPDNVITDLGTSATSATIPNGATGAFQFNCAQGTQGARIVAQAGITGAVSVTLYVNNITATTGTDYTAAFNGATRYTEVTRARTSVVIPASQATLCVTYVHSKLNPTIDDRLDVFNRRSRASLVGQIEIVNKYGFLDKAVNLSTVKGLFQNCRNAGFNAPIPPMLFLCAANPGEMNASKIVDMSALFAGCWYLTGWLPAGLLHNSPIVQFLNQTFEDCLFLKDPNNQYAIPPHFFDNSPNVTTLLQFIDVTGVTGKPRGSSLNGVLDKDLFRYMTKLNNIAYLIRGTLITGILDSDLFTYNTAITTAKTAFWACSGLTGMGARLFRTCTAMNDMTTTFAGCTNVTGPAPAFWASDSPLKNVVAKSDCFTNCPKLSNAADVPVTWGRPGATSIPTG